MAIWKGDASAGAPESHRSEFANGELTGAGSVSSENCDELMTEKAQQFLLSKRGLCFCSLSFPCLDPHHGQAVASLL